MSFSDKLIHGVTLTPDNFKNPPRELGILPFWFWNGELDPDEMEWQLKEYKDKGIPGVFLHGRFGLKVPYVSDEWFERVKIAVDLAKKIGIDMWVYDEMNWPSGTAERQVLRKYPHLKQRYLELVALNVDGPLFTFLEATDDRYVPTGNSHPIAAFACTEEEFQNGITNLIDLTPNLSFDKVIPWEAPPGKWRLLYFLEKEVPYYIDALNPESTERFIEITHERYKQAVGDDFGTIVPGFYTDEPAMHYYHVGVDNWVVPWSQQMFKIFRQRRGYDLRPYLPALYLNMGEDTARIRYDFWRTLSEQYTDTYYKRLRAWCDDNGVLFTGHLLFEEWLRLQARCEGNIFKHLEQMHIVGVDHLYPKIGTEKEPDQHVALKLASSAAHHYGSTRLLCESMGGTYWDCTLERMKWMTNWEYVLGVNLFNNHGYHYSIEGERKRDWPPSQFYQHTWWKYYDLYTTYANRLSHILSGGRHVAKVLIVYPLNSMWTNYTPQKRSAQDIVLEADFNYLTDTLLRLHYDFDYVDEDILAGATIKNGRIHLADEEYEVLVLPPMTHIKESTYKVLKQFYLKGGRVIGMTLLPVEFLDSEKNNARREIKNLFNVDPVSLYNSFMNGKSIAEKVITKKGKGRAFFFHSAGLHKVRPKRSIDKILRSCITPDVTISDENIFYLHRIKDGYDVYFLVNTAQTPVEGVEISFEKTAQPELWNPNTGDIEPVPVYGIKKNRLHITLDFPASESHIVVLKNPVGDRYIESANITIDHIDDSVISGYGNPDKPVYAKIRTKKGVRRITAQTRRALKPISLGKSFQFDLEDENVLCISRWKMMIANENQIYEVFADPSLEYGEWFDVKPGAWELQLPQERDNGHYPVVLWYRTTFTIDMLPERLAILIDGFSGSDYVIYINGKELNNSGVRSKLDAEIKEVGIRHYVQTGENTIVVRLVVDKRTNGILDHLKIIGDFTLHHRNGEYVIAARENSITVGDWTERGYPYYSGTGIFTGEVNIPQKYLNGKLFLEVDCGEDVLEVSMNGKRSVIRPWHPYSIDVSDMVVAGLNTVELRVTNTLINILEGVKKKSGIFTRPKLHHRHRYTLTLK
jgi:hypothetical protein